MSVFQGQDYIGLSRPFSSSVEEEDDDLELKGTELRLGLPGSEPSETKPGNGFSLFGTRYLKEESSNGLLLGGLTSPISGAKRGFSDEINESGKWGLCIHGGSEPNLEKTNEFLNTGTPSVNALVSPLKNKKPSPSANAQVVGWPPIRSFRKNTQMGMGLTTNSCGTYVKVSMDGAPYLRKIDLKTYTSYTQLSSALDKLFTNSLRSETEHILTYEDKDGDWMLVGDVPWEMFICSCKRLRISSSSGSGRM